MIEEVSSVRVDMSQRESNIYGAALMYAPSYSSPEIWTVLNRRCLAGKPLDEHLKIASARHEYDSGIKMINLYDGFSVAGLVYEDETAREFAQKVQDSGAEAHSVINAWNLTRTMCGEQPALIVETDREHLQGIYEAGALIDFLEGRS